jgi:preprotein translocase subunit SecG
MWRLLVVSSNINDGEHQQLMLQTLVLIVHVIACLALILIVLLQTGRGAEMGAAFGGSSQTLFGSTGGSTFLGKLTTAAAIVFMMTCLGLTYFSSKPQGKSVMEKVKVEVEEKQGPALPDAKPAQAAPGSATKAPSVADSSAAPQTVPEQGAPATGSGQSASQPAKPASPADSTAAPADKPKP